MARRGAGVRISRPQAFALMVLIFVVGLVAALVRHSGASLAVMVVMFAFLCVYAYAWFIRPQHRRGR